MIAAMLFFKHPADIYKGKQYQLTPFR